VEGKSRVQFGEGDAVDIAGGGAGGGVYVGGGLFVGDVQCYE